LVEVVSGDMKIVLPYEGDIISKTAISPHDIYLSDTKPPGPALNRYTGRVSEVVPFRSIVRVNVRIGTNRLMAELSREVFDEMNLEVGSEVFVIVKLRRLRYFLT